MLRRLRCGDLWRPRLRSGIRSGIWTWFCELVYGLVVRLRPLPRPVLGGDVVDRWGWWGGVVGGREGGVKGVRSMMWASKVMIRDWIAPG